MCSRTFRCSESTLARIRSVCGPFYYGGVDMYEGKGIDRAMFNACFINTRNRVAYELGAKPPLGSDSSLFDKSDCSGFSRWILSRTLDGFTGAFPDGSANQHEWCKANLP